MTRFSKDRSKPGVVYVVTDSREPERVRYVGRTVAPLHTRVRNHWYLSTRKAGAFQNWLRARTDRQEDVWFTVISSHPDVASLNKAEMEAIALYRSLGQADLNRTDGGDGGWGRQFTPEQAEAHRQRVPRGEGHWRHKLSSEMVAEIRELRVREYRMDQDLADRYGVSRSSISSVLKNDLWHDPDFDPRDVIRPPRKGMRAANRKLTAGEVDEIRKNRQARYEPAPQIAKRYGVSHDMIYRILANKNWIDPNYDPTTLKGPQ